MNGHEPLVGGLRLGGLVEVHGLSQKEDKKFAKPVNGQYGQIVSYTGGDKENFLVHLANGISGHFSPKNVRKVANPKKPGEGGGETSFDLLLAPRTEAGALGQELSRCMLEKGFCVLKHSQNDDKNVQRTVQFLKEAGENGNLGRFPQECEEGYLGKGCQGKVVWMDDDVADLANEETLVRCDKNLSMLGQVLQPYSYDLLDEWVDERSPALVCLSLSKEEEDDYPFPEPDDDTLGVFLQTWRRTQVRAVHFLGPGTADIELIAKDKSGSPVFPSMQGRVKFKAAPNTIFLFRFDAYEYKCSTPQETIMLITNFLSRGPQYDLKSIEGNLGWLQRDGPPPPPGDRGVHVVNMTTRLPANSDHDSAYHTALVSSTDAVTEVPHSRWDVDAYWSPNEDSFEAHETTTRHQSFCEGAELFDNKYFEIGLGEARNMDPVQRMVLEAGAQSMMSIGLSKKVTNRKPFHAGFAVGNDKLDWMIDVPREGGPPLGQFSTVLAVIANRFSFVFNLKGPNFVCDSSCSAALCATHCAKLMMLDQKFDPLEFFLCMGAHLCLSVGPFIACSQSHMTSPQGRCFTFDQSANGYCRGEGVSGFMLKYGNLRGKSEALLRATQIGQDGRSASLSAPNGPAQDELITRTMKEAQMTAPESTAWECHGTGVALGDPIEVGAIRKVHIRIARTEPLMLATNKSNIGHSEGGSAMTAMCKCIIQCRHASGFAGNHVRELNAHLEHSSFDAFFQTLLVSFEHAQGHSQVSSLGFGGTNGHGIFWGESLEAMPDLKMLWKKKVAARPQPEVRPLGPNPDDWEADFPDSRTLRNGTQYQITMSPDDPVDQPVKFELKQEAPDLDIEDVGHYYYISGNFNKWGQDNMTATDVAGLSRFVVQVPESGTVEWRFLKDGDVNAVIAPKFTPCSRKSEAIVGPQKGLKNKWVVYEEPGNEVTIEFFCKRGVRSVMWLVKKDSSSGTSAA